MNVATIKSGFSVLAAALAGSLMLASAALAGANYAREQKWHDEIVPGIVVGEPVYLEQKNGHRFLGIYTDTADARMGIVVAHGTGVHPDAGVVGALRQRLADRGYATLAIQMPILAVDAKPEAYAKLFPEAVERLQRAVSYVQGKGHSRVAVVSHSMGARMSHAYLRGNPPAVYAWAALGMPAPLGKPQGAITYEGIKLPILDLYGTDDEPQVRVGAGKRRQSLAGNPASKQQVITDADHFYTGREDQLIDAITNFLDGLRRP